jgi:hypothetical protein
LNAGGLSLLARVREKINNRDSTINNDSKINNQQSTMIRYRN